MTISEKLTKIAEDMSGVYQCGTHEGYAIGYNVGQQMEHDIFWDAYQGYGNRTNYASAFYNEGWNDVSYNPKHNINMLNGNNCFSYSTITDTKVDIDVSKATTNITNLFLSCARLRTIKKLIVSENTAFTNVFMNCSALEEIRFEGTIGKSLDIHWSTKLSFMSLVSIVGALSKTVTGQTIIFPTTARDTYDSATISGSWDELRKEYMNWTFDYA